MAHPKGFLIDFSSMRLSALAKSQQLIDTFVIDKCIVITGGNRGIGYAFTRAVAQAGADVAILYRSVTDFIIGSMCFLHDLGALKMRRTLLQRSQANSASKSRYGSMFTACMRKLTLFKAYKCDVSDTDLVNQTFETIDKELGPITGVICVC
jgi:sorbose reductase